MQPRTPERTSTAEVNEAAVAEGTPVKASTSTQTIMATVKAPILKSAITQEELVSAPKAIAALSFLELLRGDYFGSTLLAMTSAYYGMGAENRTKLATTGMQAVNIVCSNSSALYSWAKAQTAKLTGKETQEKAPRYTN